MVPDLVKSKTARGFSVLAIVVVRAKGERALLEPVSRGARTERHAAPADGAISQSPRMRFERRGTHNQLSPFGMPVKLADRHRTKDRFAR